jgi:hypothetical protein
VEWPKGEPKRGNEVDVRVPLFHRDRVTLRERKYIAQGAWWEEKGLPRLCWKDTVADALERLADLPDSSHPLDSWDDGWRFWRAFASDAAEKRLAYYSARGVPSRGSSRP